MLPTDVSLQLLLSYPLLLQRFSPNTDTILLSVSLKKDSSHETVLDINRYTNSTEQSLQSVDRRLVVSSLVLHADELKKKLQDMIYMNGLIPMPAVPNELHVPQRNNHVDESKYTVESPTIPFTETLQPPHVSTGNKIQYKAQTPNIVVGNADLDPFPTGIWIGPQSSSSIPHPLGPLPGTGSYVGPDHPMFQQDFGPDDDYNHDPSIFGSIPPQYLPQPRFDPFGPVLGPNCDFSVGNVGVDSRGRRVGPNGRGGRSGGRSGLLHPNRGNFPGEPNPDHLKPPGW